jgi:ribosomal small subunit protein bTHX
MGRGDKRSRKGKITRGSYGTSRPKPAKVRKIHAAYVAAKAAAAE